MTNRVRTLAIGLGVVFGLAGPIAGAPGSTVGPLVACAADDGPRAVLVVDNGARVQRLCVALDAATVSGIHLVELASDQHGLSYALGFGGQAVCVIDGVGPTGGDCFAEYPEFWGYWHGNGSGGWTWASSGAASFRVGDGDVEGWVWGSGDTPSTHRAPPPTRATDVCPASASDPDPPSGGSAGGGNGAGGEGSAPAPGESGETTSDRSPAGGGTDEPAVDRQAERRAERTAERAEARAAERQEERAADATVPSVAAGDQADADVRAGGTAVPGAGGGPPLGAIVAAAAALALGGAGWWRLRRTPGAAA